MTRLGASLLLHSWRQKLLLHPCLHATSRQTDCRLQRHRTRSSQMQGLHGSDPQCFGESPDCCCCLLHPYATGLRSHLAATCLQGADGPDFPFSALNHYSSQMRLQYSPQLRRSTSNSCSHYSKRCCCFWAIWTPMKLLFDCCCC